MTFEETALQFATAAHASIGQKRKYSDDPYIVHPIRVAGVVKALGLSQEAVAAALMHDTVEDVPLPGLISAAVGLGWSPVWFSGFNVEDDPFNPLNRALRLEVVEVVFSPRTVALVEMVTDVSLKSDGNRRVRKAIDREHLAKADEEGQTIKLADLIDNARDICVNDPGFAHKWMSEKRDILSVLTKGDRGLFEQAQGLVDEFFARKP